MIATQADRRSPLLEHWFIFAAAFVVAGDVFAAFTSSWSAPRVLEAGILVDLVVVVPLLYLWCYRREGRRALVRAVALACLGIWASGKLVPEAHQSILGALKWFRRAVVAVLFPLQ